MDRATTLLDWLTNTLRWLVTVMTLLLPSLSLALITIIAIIPNSLGVDWRFVPALLPLAVVHYWADRRWMTDDAPILPALLVFAAGLVIDAMSSGPLGYFALLYLSTMALAYVLARPLARAGLNRWLRFIAVTAVVVALAWSVASLYFATVAEVRALVYAAFVVILTEPPIAALLAMATPARALRASFTDRRS